MTTRMTVLGGIAALAAAPAMAQPAPEVLAQLAPTGVLRAAINMGNFLLVSGKTPEGEPDGVGPDMARAIAARLGVPVRLLPYARPGMIADVANTGAWDIGTLADEPQRAAVIAFSPAYVEIQATYLVPAGSPITAMDQVDRPGIRIAVPRGAAYALWLERNIRSATLVQFPSIQATFEGFVQDRLDVLGGLRPGLLEDQKKLPGARLLDGRFMAVQQAIGTGRAKVAGAAFLRGFVEEAKASGLVARLIEKHHVVGLSVAPPA